MKLLCIVLLFLALFASTAFAWEARVVHVYAGDIIHVEPVNGGDRVRVRLWGIDCPETNQPYGQATKRFVADLCLFKTVEIGQSPQGEDPYGRTLAMVRLSGGRVLQELLLYNGYAWVHPNAEAKVKNWNSLQRSAAKRRVGLWQDLDGETKPVAPWVWRMQK